MDHVSQFTSVKAKKSLRKYQSQFREKLRKLRLRQNGGFSIKKCVLLSSVIGVLFKLSNKHQNKPILLKTHHLKML